MPDERREQLEAEESEIIEVPRTESPSENFFVAEHLQRMPNIFSRGLIYLTLLILFTALIYALLAQIDIVVESTSVARPALHKIKILSGTDGYIERIFISEGQVVEKGSPLFLIRSKEAISYRSKVDELRRSIPLQREYYDTKVSSAKDELLQLASEYENTLTVKELRLEQNTISLGSIKSDLTYWNKEKRRLSREFEDTIRLVEKGFISSKEHAKLESELESARAEVEKLISQQNITLHENKIIEEEIKDARSNYENKRNILEKEIKKLRLEKETTIQSLKSELEMNEKLLSIKNGSLDHEENPIEKGTMIRSENDATVSELYFRTSGEYVRESDLLCTLIPSESPLYMDITVANKDVGFIETGMEIKYKFDAFPYIDYGTLSGTVSAISPSAVEDETLGFVYNLRGTLGQTYFEVKEKRYPVKPGMTAVAELITERKSIFSMLFKKLREKF